MTNFKESIYDLIVETSTNLPPDVRRALSNAMDLEKEGNQSSLALQTIAMNVESAAELGKRRKQ